MNTQDRLMIKAFRAWDDPQRANMFVQEHAQVLTDAGVLEALPHDTSWRNNEDCIVIVAEHPELGMVGGCRIQVKREGEALPIEKSLSPIIPDFQQLAGELLRPGNAELCGLWVAQRFTGHGLPWLVTAAAVAVLNQVDTAKVLCLAAEYSATYAISNGFRIQSDIGTEGWIPFPIPSIRSFALALLDPIHLSTAGSAERQRLLSLRINPIQRRQETLKGRPFDVYFDLQLLQRVIPFTPSSLDPSRTERRTA